AHTRPTSAALPLLALRAALGRSCGASPACCLALCTRGSVAGQLREELEGAAGNFVQGAFGLISFRRLPSCELCHLGPPVLSACSNSGGERRGEDQRPPKTTANARTRGGGILSAFRRCRFLSFTIPRHSRLLRGLLVSPN